MVKMPQGCQAGLRRPLVYSILFLAVLLYAGFFTRLSVLKYMSFFSFGEGDVLAQQNNLFWQTTLGRFFYHSIGEDTCDHHFSLFYFPVALIYRASPHIFTLFVLRHLALALGVLPIFGIARRHLGSDLAGLLAGFSYLMFNPLHHLSFVDFDGPMVPFAITFLLFSFYFFERGVLAKFILASALAMTCRDEATFFIITFGILAMIRKMPLRWKLVPVFLGAGYFLAARLIIIPYSCPSGYSTYINNFLGGNPQGLSFGSLLWSKLAELLQKLLFFSNLPRAPLLGLFSPPVYLVSLLAPEILLMSLPNLLAVLLASTRYFVSLDQVHHTAYFVPVIFLGALYGLRRAAVFFYRRMIPGDRVTQEGLFVVAAAGLLMATCLPHFGNNIIFRPSGAFRDHRVADQRFFFRTNMYDPVFYFQDSKDKKAWEFIRLIPAHASVSTTQTYLPSLSRRERIYHFGCRTEVSGRYGHDFDADYVFLNKKDDYNGFGGMEVSHEEVLRSLRLLLGTHGYEVVKEDEDFVLLRKPEKHALAK